LLYYANFFSLICKFGNKEAFFGRRFAFCNANKFCAIQLPAVFRIGKLKALRSLTGKGADIFVCDTKNNSALHFAIDIIKLLLVKEGLLSWRTEMSKICSRFQLNLANWKHGNFFFLLKRFCFEEG